jgi:hypothetical protein
MGSVNGAVPPYAFTIGRYEIPSQISYGNDLSGKVRKFRYGPHDFPDISLPDDVEIPYLPDRAYCGGPAQRGSDLSFLVGCVKGL